MNEPCRAAGLLLLSALAGCQLAPAYRPPAIDMPPHYKEASADTGAEALWAPAEPHDAVLRGAWWEIFHDAQLDALERQLNLSNQGIAAAFAGFEQARAVVRESRAAYLPTLTASASVTRQRALIPAGSSTATYSSFDLPFDASWTPDVWNRVRDSVRGAAAAAQASAADLESTRLTMQSELAVDYFAMHAQDSLIELQDQTVGTYREALEFTRAQLDTGVGSPAAVAQAEVQLSAALVQATNLRIARAQDEHAIALLIGRSASLFSLAATPLAVESPTIPLSLPSRLLERRPDIAGAERLMAQANASIGVARSAYFPVLTLSAEAGFESTSLAKWLQWPSRVWALGPSVADTLFDAGLRRATVEQYRSAYEQAVANYRQTVLTAFQQVEDQLAAVRILETELEQQRAAVAAAQRNFAIATDRYRLGLDPYIDAVTAQSALLAAQQSLITLTLSQVSARVQLIEALGGGWDRTQLPDQAAIAERAPLTP